MKTTFEPARHGFHFSNSDIQWSFGPITAKALCGGMVYSALDYFLGGLSIPSQTDVAQEGTPVHDHIYKRQLSAHWNTVYRFADNWLNTRTSHDQFELLKKYMAQNHPIPVCFYNGVGDGHHTLGIACSDGPIPYFKIYDPNYPDKTSIVTSENGRYKMSVGGKLWNGFFVDHGYRPERPNVIEGDSGWMRCIDCRLLYMPGTKSICPKGGNHNPQGSAKYILSLNSGNGDRGWRLCTKCGSLFRMGGDSGVCAAGGVHAPISFLKYTLGIGGVGQDNWRRCVTCDGLFWLSGGGIGGVCSGGGRHRSDLSKIYTLPFQS